MYRVTYEISENDQCLFFSVVGKRLTVTAELVETQLWEVRVTGLGSFKTTLNPVDHKRHYIRTAQELMSFGALKRLAGIKNDQLANLPIERGE